MQENWTRAVAAVWQFDGIKDDEAPGEHFVTTYGITATTWRQARALGIVDKDQDTCTPDDAKSILKALYWDKTACDEWPSGVDLMVFDFAMLAGNKTAIMELQQAVLAEEDGIIGIETMTKVARAARLDTPALINNLKARHLDYLSGLNDWDEFG